MLQKLATRVLMATAFTIFHLSNLLYSPATLAQQNATTPAEENSPAPSSQTQENPQASYLLQLLELGCVPAISGGDTLDTFALIHHFPTLADWLTRELLQGAIGDAFDASGKHGQFMIAASRFTCSIYAQKMDGRALRVQLEQWLEKGPLGLRAQKPVTQAGQTPNGYVESTLYNLTQAGGAVGAQISLTTSQDPRAPMQAVLAILVAPR